MMKKRYLLGLLPVIVVGLYFSGIDLEGISGKLTDQKVNSYISDSGEIEVYFCPHEDCETALADFIGSAKEYIHCALFELDLELVQNRLLEKSNYLDVKVITDNDYLYEFDYSFVKTDTWGLMHNKFCIIDGKRVSSGSMNPTVNGATKNNNNLLLIESSVLAANYEAEFQEMWNGTFKKGEEVLNPQVNLGNITISSYFCPEDCKIQLSSTGQEVGAVYIISDLIRNAKESIYFMTFSFTHEKIGNAILLRHLEGNVTIKGIFESRGSGSEYSNYKVFEYQGIDVIKDKNPGAMHHKVFIIDEETVVTGSFNPSNNGENNNDENILIIKDKAIAQKYLEEFNRLYAEFS